MEFLRWIVVSLLTVALAVVVVMNRNDVTLYWSPLHEPLQLPCYLILLFFAAIGFVFGSFIVWVNYAPLRREKRRQKKELIVLEKQIKNPQEQTKNSTASGSILPLIPKM